MRGRGGHAGGRGRQQGLRQALEATARLEPVRYHDGGPQRLYGWLYRGRGIIRIILHWVSNVARVTRRRRRIHSCCRTVHRQLLTKRRYGLVMLQLFVGRGRVHAASACARAAERHAVRGSPRHSILRRGLVGRCRQEGALRGLRLWVSSEGGRQ